MSPDPDSTAPRREEPRAWHALEAAEVARALGTHPERGLERDEAARRLEQHGPNELPASKGRGPLLILVGQVTDLMMLVLLGAALVSGLLGEARDAIAILVIVLLNAIIGAVQELRAERALAALRELSSPSARAVRGGAPATVPAEELVPGDLVQLEAGEVVPADLRLIATRDLRVDESALTGESVPVEKEAGLALEAGSELAERRNMAHRGTPVTRGRATGLVVATGARTELGRIAKLLHGARGTRTPLERRLSRLGRKLALAVLGVCAVVFAAGLLRGEDVLLMFMTAVSLGVAAIPEALPAVVTVSLALGARRMAKRNALVRRLPAVETLGSVTFVCADKTGTLTQNRMTVAALVAGGRRVEELPRRDGAGEPWEQLGRAMALVGDAGREGDEHAGDPTELALLAAARSAGFEREELERDAPRELELAFESERKRMTTVHRADGGAVAYVKGAPEVVLELCVDELGEEGARPLDREAAQAAAEELAGDGQRVLAFATRRLEALPERADADELERELTFLGFAGLIDPPRPEAARAVEQCKGAGITPVMITGDHPSTALAIARQLEIAGEGDIALTGRQIEELAPEELTRQVRTNPVFARVSPEQKIQLVEALQRSGEFVAMTGDGVNDAPALKKAEIGVAMGGRGTEVAREAADMVLLDDDFATIVAAVREGRHVFDNVRKFVRYTLTSNSGEIWTLFLAPFLGLPIPLLPIHILWVNLVTDGLPGLALAAEPEERGLMQRPPRPPKESLFAHGLGAHVLWVGLLIGGLSLGAQAWSHGADSVAWQSVVFTTLVFTQLGHALAIRSERESLFTIGLFSNRPLLGAVLLTVLLQLAVVYVPWLQPIFSTEAMSALELGVCFATPLVVIAAVELEKLVRRRGSGAG